MIFVDSGAFIARYIAADDHHALATRCWRELEEARTSCSTSNFVLDETFTLLARRTGYGFAADRARGLLSSRSLEILRPDHGVELEAVQLFAKYADQRVSFTDCVSFVLMQRKRIRKTFTFDRHFQMAGFETWP